MHRVRGWETSERLREAGEYESRQRALVDDAVVEASETGARWLGVAYWDAITRFTRGAVRARWSGAGGELRLLGGIVLLTFAPAQLSFAAPRVSCTHAIRGGLLALRAGGSVSLAQQQVADGFELSVTVDGYSPRLGASVFARSQGPFHAAVSRHYFASLERRLGAP